MPASSLAHDALLETGRPRGPW